MYQIPVYQISYNFKDNVYVLNGQELHDGDSVTVLIFGAFESAPRWVKTTIRYSEETFGWYLEDAEEYNIAGLFAKAYGKERS